MFQEDILAGSELIGFRRRKKDVCPVVFEGKVRNFQSSHAVEAGERAEGEHHGDYRPPEEQRLLEVRGAVAVVLEELRGHPDQVWCKW